MLERTRTVKARSPQMSKLGADSHSVEPGLVGVLQGLRLISRSKPYSWLVSVYGHATLYSNSWSGRAVEIFFYPLFTPFKVGDYYCRSTTEPRNVSIWWSCLSQSPTPLPTCRTAASLSVVPVDALLLAVESRCLRLCWASSRCRSIDGGMSHSSQPSSLCQ